MQRMAEQFDAIVIGAGQAGPALCARLDKEGLKTALIERKLLGGTCVNNGCIPTKTLVASAHAAHVARRGGDYGFSAGEIRVDMRAVKGRKDGVVKHSTDFLAEWIAGMKRVSLLQGQAKFTAPRAVSVGGRALEAGKIFINVGARAAIPDLPGVKHIPFLTNSTMMGVDFLPEHLVIVGGSYIGLEFAQEGVGIRTGAECMELKKNGRRIVVGLECKDGEPLAEGSHVLLAVGRAPNTDDLGLDKANIEKDDRGFIKVDDECRTSAEGVWALGDVNGRGAFTHTSYNDYEIVAANLFDGDRRRISDRIMTYALFIDPPLGRAGMNEQEARRSGKRVLGAKMPMARVGRAREAGETQGFMKVLVDAESKALLGASLIGLNADEVVHSLLDIMYAKQPYTTIQRAVHIHPTVTELVPTLLGSLKPLA